LSFYSEKGIKRRRSRYNSKEILCFLAESEQERRSEKMGIVCLAGIFAVFLLLAWTLCRAAGWEKEREDLEQEQYLKEWRGEKMEKNEERHGARFIYAASTFLVLVVFVIGVTMINNYDKMQGVQQSLDTISKSVSNKEGDKVMETGGEVIEEEKEQEGDKILEEPENPEAQILEDDIYVVEKGDTLATISRKVYGDISHVEAICKMNGLENGNLIFIGQKLLLP